MFLYITFDVSRLEGQAAVSVHTNPLTTATILVIRNHTTAITRQLQYFSDWPLMTSYRYYETGVLWPAGITDTNCIVLNQSIFPFIENNSGTLTQTRLGWSRSRCRLMRSSCVSKPSTRRAAELKWTEQCGPDELILTVCEKETDFRFSVAQKVITRWQSKIN